MDSVNPYESPKFGPPPLPFNVLGLKATEWLAILSLGSGLQAAAWASEPWPGGIEAEYGHYRSTIVVLGVIVALTVVLIAIVKVVTAKAGVSGS